MKLSTVTVEMKDGTVHENVRIILIDRLRLEKAARANNWDMGDQNFTPSISAFLGWAACERAGLIHCTFEEFSKGECKDLAIENAEAVLGDPTQTEATTV